MKKILMTTFALLFASQTFALSCARPEPLPALQDVQENYQTIGLLKIISTEEENFIETNPDEEFPDITAEGNPRKFTTFKAQWKNLVKGAKNNQKFLLRINATSWMGYPTKFDDGSIISITTNATISDGTMTLNQDFGCGTNDWGRYSETEIKTLKTKNNNLGEPSPWQKLLEWINLLFE